MKVTLFAVGALILLSSITSIFNNLVVVDTSAQLYDEDAVDALVEKYEKQGDYYAISIMVLEILTSSSSTMNKVLMNIQVMITMNHLIMGIRMIQVIVMMMVMVLKTHTTRMTNIVNIRQKKTKNIHAVIQD